MSTLNQGHIEILRSGSANWNVWRQAHPKVIPQLAGANLAGANLAGANLAGANLAGANLAGANLARADLDRADLSGTNLLKADLGEAYLVGADFERALLQHADLSMCLALQARFPRAKLDGVVMRAGIFAGAQFEGASLRGALLEGSQLDGADLAGADLTGASVYGVAAWKVTLERKTPQGRLVAKQTDLLITYSEAEEVRVDDLRIAQLIYLVQDNARISDVIQGMSNRAVLVLGRFTPDARMEILDVIRDKLRDHGYLPVIFNFSRPEDRDWTETVRILAGLSRFVIVDLTDPRSVPLELEAIVPSYQIPFLPIFEKDSQPFAMFQNLWNQFAWVLDPFNYHSKRDIETHFEEAIIERANSERERLKDRKGRPMRVLNPSHFGGSRGT